MKNTFRLLSFSSVIIVVAWIAKMHFVYGGDILFRTATAGLVLALIIQSVLFAKHEEIRETKSLSLFLFNSVSLSILYIGMMLKVSHLLNTQFEKDLVLDFMGLPLVAISIFLNAGKAETITRLNRNTRLLFIRHILTPWLMMMFSFILYALFSAILARQ
jgi:hypothetical protein